MSATTLRTIRSGVKPALLTRAWHRLQERIRQPALRVAVANAIARFRPRATVPSTFSDNAATLLRDGVVLFPAFVAPEDILRIREQLSACECVDPWRPQLGRFAPTAIPRETHVAQIVAAPCFTILHRIALDPRILTLATSYFGCKPYLDSIQAWWSVSGHDEPEDAENFHRDNDSIRFLKFFLYATDVSTENGPHVFVAGSQREPALLERRRFDDDEVLAAFGSDRIRTMTGRAGDAFLEDTFGLHKGQLPRSGVRLLVQFRYSVTESVFRSPLVVERPPFYDARQTTGLMYDT